MIFQKITIYRLRKAPSHGVSPGVNGVNEELQHFGTSLGLFSLRDRDKSCFRLFITLLQGARLHHAFTSDELAHHLHLSRATVIHHLNKLMEAGIVINSRGKYLLRVERLSLLIDEIKKDMETSLNEIKETAQEIDNALGL